MASNKRPTPKIFEHKPQPTIAAAVAAAKAHVAKANKS